MDFFNYPPGLGRIPKGYYVSSERWSRLIWLSAGDKKQKTALEFKSGLMRAEFSLFLAATIIKPQGPIPASATRPAPESHQRRNFGDRSQSFH